MASVNFGTKQAKKDAVTHSRTAVAGGVLGVGKLIPRLNLPAKSVNTALSGAKVLSPTRLVTTQQAKAIIRREVKAINAVRNKLKSKSVHEEFLRRRSPK